jgi:hypothetical protein
MHTCGLKKYKEKITMENFFKNLNPKLYVWWLIDYQGGGYYHL